MNRYYHREHLYQCNNRTKNVSNGHISCQIGIFEDFDLLFPLMVQGQYYFSSADPYGYLDNESRAIWQLGEKMETVFQRVQ